MTQLRNQPGGQVLYEDASFRVRGTRTSHIMIVAPFSREPNEDFTARTIERERDAYGVFQPSVEVELEGPDGDIQAVTVSYEKVSDFDRAGLVARVPSLAAKRERQDLLEYMLRQLRKGKVRRKLADPNGRAAAVEAAQARIAAIDAALEA